MQTTLPQRDPQHLLSLGTCVPSCISHPREGAARVSPFPVPSGPAGTVTAGMLCVRIGLVCPGGLGAGGFLEVCSPSSTPRGGQVTSLFLARQRSERRAREGAVPVPGMLLTRRG